MGLLDNFFVNFTAPASAGQASVAKNTEKESIAQNPVMMAYQRMSMEAGLRRPQGITFATLRRMSRVNWVDRACIKTLTDEITGCPWDIIPIDTKKPYNENLQKFLVLLLQQPNQNKESWRMLIDKVVEDIMVCDAGCIEKVRDQKGRVAELYYIDGTCYSDDTEVLTKDGWKLFKDVDIEQDRFATRNQITHAFEWQQATYKHVKEWDGDFYHFSSRSLDVLVSPNHRVLYNPNPGITDKEFIKTAEEVAKLSSNIALPAVSNWSGEEITSFTFPAKDNKYKAQTPITMSGDQYVAFMGMYLAEGCFTNGKTTCISQMPQSKGYFAYKNLLTEIFGAEPAYSTNTQWQLYKKPLYDYLSQFGKASEKYIPELIMNASVRQIEIFLQYYILGDGWIDGARKGIVTSSKKMADQLQELIQKSGYSTSISTEQPKKDKHIGARIITKEHQKVSYRIRIRTSKYQRFDKEKVQYKGTIYCVSVPNEILYVRRNGKPIWCGNTIKPCYDIKGMLGTPVAYEQYLPTPTNTEPMASFSKWDLIRMQWNPTGNIDNYGWGLSPVEAGLAVATAFLNAEAYNMSFFQRNTIPPVIINLGEDVPENEVTAFRAYLAAEMQGQQGFWQPFAMAGGKGFDIKELMKNPAEMAFQEYVEWQMKWKVALYRMSPQDIGFNTDQYKVQGDTQLQLSQNKAINSLKDVIEGYINTEIINDPGWGIDPFSINLQFQWIDGDAVDPLDQATIDQIYWSMGVYEGNYIRKERFGLDPIEGGKVPLITAGGKTLALNPKLMDESAGTTEEDDGGDDTEEEEAEKVLSKHLQVQKVFSPDEGHIVDLSMNATAVAWMDDRGVTQPLFITDYAKQMGFTVKPDFLDVKRDQEPPEAAVALILRKLGGNTPEVRIMDYDEVLQLIPAAQYPNFTKWINVEAPFDSMEWRQRWGDTRKSEKYIVTGFITGQDLNNKELQQAMRASPDTFKEAVKDFARIWLLEKRFYLGDRKPGHYIITREGNGFGVDYQFFNTKSSWEKTSKYLPSVLKELDGSLYEYFVQCLVSEFNAMEKVEKALRLKPKLWSDMTQRHELEKKMSKTMQKKLVNWYKKAVHVNKPTVNVKKNGTLPQVSKGVVFDPTADYIADGKYVWQGKNRFPISVLDSQIDTWFDPASEHNQDFVAAMQKTGMGMAEIAFASLLLLSPVDYAPFIPLGQIAAQKDMASNLPDDTTLVKPVFDQDPYDDRINLLAGSMHKTMKDAIDTILEKGVENNDTYGMMHDKILTTLGIDPNDVETPGYRAERIAKSEAMWAVREASVQQYEAQGITSVNLQLADNPCEMCQGIAADNPYGVDEASDMGNGGFHPNCECEWSGVFDDYEKTLYHAVMDAYTRGFVKIHNKIRLLTDIAKDWVTINGRHVYIGDDGKAYYGKEAMGRAKQEKARATMQVQGGPGEFANFKDLTDAPSADYKQFEKDNTHPWTPEEKASANEYQGPASMFINGELRGNLDESYANAAPAFHVEENMKNLDSALARSPLSQDTTLWHGGNFPEGLKPGDSITDPGYWSTSISEKSARSFVDPKEGDGMAAIYASKGSPGLVMNAAVPGNDMRAENEVLMPRNTTYEVISARLVTEGGRSTMNYELKPVLAGKKSISKADDGIEWITVNGQHIPLKNGQPTTEAGRRILGQANKGNSGKELISKNPTKEEIEKLDPELSSAFIGGYRGEGDKTLAKIYEKQGFNAKPRQVSEKEFNQLVKDGQPGLYRGVSQKAYVDDFINGEKNYAGLGLFGNGTYTTTSLETARLYDIEGNIIKMTLEKGTKIVETHDLYREMTAAEKATGLLHHPIFADAGRYAALRGYDAIKVGGDMPDDIIHVVLNRGKVVIPK